MEKLVNALDGVDTETIKAEVEGSRIKNSETLNRALRKEYKNYKQKSSKALLLRIWHFTLTTTGNPRGGKTISRIWLRMFKSLDRIIKALFKNENTMESVLTEFRKPIKENFGADSEIYKQSIYNMGVSQERSKERKQEYAERVKARNASRAELQPLYVEDVLEVIQKLKFAPDPYEKSLSVLLATGSRSIELFKVSEYYEVKDDPTKITVKGLAKDKGLNDLQNVVLTRNLVGLTSDEVVKMVSEIRDELDVKGSNQKISSQTNTPLNKAFQKWIQPLAPDFPMTSHKCRYIAGNISYLLYGKPAKIPYESYLQEQYGHLSGESTRSYLAINIQFRNKIVQKAPDDLKLLFENENNQMKRIIQKNCLSKKAEIDLTLFSNSHRRTLDRESKIINIAAAIEELKKNKIKMTQRELRGKLGYGAEIMTAGYQLAREKGII